MSAYMVFTYDITDPAGYEPYTAAAFPSILESGAEVLAADYATEAIEGTPGQVTIVLRFESKDAARAWYESDSYQAARPIRQASTNGVAMLADEFVMPG